MQQHVRGARRVGAREIADDRVESEDGLDRLAREPAIENVAGAFREEVDEVAALGQRQRAQLPAGPHQIEQRRDILRGSRPDIRRRHAQHAAQHRGDAIEHRVIRGQRLGIAARKLRHLRLRRRDAAADLQIFAIGQRQEVGERPRANGKTMLREPEIADHPRVEQADRVARGRVAKAGMEFLGDRGAAHDVAAFGDAHREARGGEIRGAGEAVVAAADDDGVEAARVTRHRVRQPPSRIRSRRT